MNLLKGGMSMEQLADVDLAETEVTGLFGYPVEHSLSPKMHNAGFEELEINYLYLPFAVQPENLEQAVAGIRGLGIRGVNLTIPHKEEVIPYLDELSEEAELIGAVNTIVNQNGKLVGHNTDGRGYIRSLQEGAGFAPDNKEVLIIGAGGAARAVAFQLALEGIDKLYIANRTFSKAEKLAAEIRTKIDLKEITALDLTTEALTPVFNNLDLVVDTTPIGMVPDTDVKPVIEPGLLDSNLLVSDLVYNPQETVLLQAAKEAGAETVSGLGMLLYQGVIAFELWTDRQAPVEEMQAALEKNI